MSKLDELILGLCPDGVEYKTLGEIAVDIYRGAGITRDQVTAEGTPCVRYGEIYTTYGVWFDKCVSHTDESKLLSKKYFEHGDILFAITGESVDDIAKCCAYIGHEKCLAGGDIVVLKHNQNPKYLSYALATTDARQQKSKGKVKSKVVHSSVPAIREIKVPIPPIEIQREIVRILDDYTENIVELQNQLTAEITARQRQYEFYRDKLLTFDALGEGTINFYQRTLGELFDFRNGLSKGKEFFGKGTPFIRYTDVYNHRTLRKKDITALVECTEGEKERLKVSRGDVLFTRTSETAEDIGWSSVMLDDMDDCVFNGFTIKATPKTKELLPEYCAYCFSTSDFRQYVTKHCAFTTRASLTGNTIAQYRMTIPPLDIQSRIVNVLDNFEKICSDLNIGLPAEIEARQKQYEYYRDKLLMFKEVAAT